MAKLTSNPDEILTRANALFRAEQSQDLRAVVAKKIQDLRRYDVLAMDRVAAIVMWGRSGSLLLSSYLDGHADAIGLPEISGQRLFEFFDRYPSLPWHEKLIAYPAFEPNYPRLFEGAFAISPAQYYAAVEAIIEFYADWPPEFLTSRRAFFLFVHIAYNLALGRQPESPRPLIIFAQHDWDNRVARHLVEDFPETKFIHTIRDPISSCDGVFHSHFAALTERFPRTYVIAPHNALFCLTERDRPHVGMESRTRTIRFEDLHRDAAGTMHDISDWLGLRYQASLLDSTFNGIPYVVTRDGKAWSGPRMEQLQRNSRDLSAKDRALLFALFYENFVEWNYPVPKIFRHSIVRYIVFLALFLVPTNMEFIAARAIFKRRIMPSLRHGSILPAVKSLLGIGLCRLRIIGLLTPAFWRRCLHGTTLLHVGHAPYSRSTPESELERGGAAHVRHGTLEE